MRVLFDVDGTLIESGSGSDGGGRPKAAMVHLLTALAASGHLIYVASSGGRGYAVEQCMALGIRDLVRIVEKEPDDYDLVIDDDPGVAQGLGRQLLHVRSGVLDADTDAPWL